MLVTRWLAISAGGIALALYAVFVPSDSAASSERCGLGLPPGATGFAEAATRDEAEVRNNGFLRVCEANLERYEVSFRPIVSAVAGLAFQPVDLSRTPFAKLKSLGGLPEAVNDTKSRLYRGFRMPDGHTLTLFEHDMSADGSRSWRDARDEPERINGLAARLVVLETGAGKAVSSLSWTEGRRYYELWINANVARQPLRDQLFALAASLPASVPACPNEPESKPLRFGPDGRPPAALTVEQMNAQFEKSRRPCKWSGT